MAIWTCIEKIAAMAGGCVALAASGHVDAGLAVGTLSAGAGILGFFREQREKHGPESDRELAKIRTAVLARFDLEIANYSFAEADVNAADAALERSLAKCMLDRTKLAQSAVTPDGFPARATAVVLDALAKVEPIFGPEGTQGASATCRSIATAVIETALNEAVKNKDYFAHFQKDLLIEMARVLGDVAVQQAEMLALLRKLEARDSNTQQAIIEGVDPALIITVAQKFSPGVADKDQAIAALERAAEDLASLKRQAAAGTNLGDLVDEAVRRIAARIAAEDFAGAVSEGEAAFDRLAEREAEQRATAKAGLIKLADENRRVHFLSGDAAGTARWIARGLALEAEAAEAPLAALDAAHTAYWERGRDQGLNLDLEIAAALAGQALGRPGLDADQRGNWWNNLGIALATLGEREAGTARLDAAVRAYEAALLEYTRERAPLNWAATQNNLGNVLQTLGEREAGTAQLDTAVRAYEAALTE